MTATSPRSRAWPRQATASATSPAAKRTTRELLALKRRIYNAPHDAIARALRELASIVLRAEKYAEAEALLNEALAMQRQVFGEDHRRSRRKLRFARRNHGCPTPFRRGRRRLRAALAVCERARISEESLSARARNNLGMSFYRQDRLDEAKREMSQALAERRALLGNDHPTVAYSLSTLANVAVKQDDGAEAVRLSVEALAILDRSGRGASREAVLIRHSHAAALFRAGRNAEALPEIDRTIVDWQRVAPGQQGAPRHDAGAESTDPTSARAAYDDARKTAREAIAVGAPRLPNMRTRTKQLCAKSAGAQHAYRDSAADTH
jgi:tetratricopeptide (TPR) repeat protein